jgi:hypothetical protein
MTNTTHAAVSETLSLHVATLDDAICWLTKAPQLVGGQAAVDKAIRDGQDPAALVETYKSALAKLRELIELREKIDPHVLTSEELTALRRKPPMEIVEEALKIGRLRERRILVEAKDAETNNWLARLTAAASIIALAAFIVDVILRFYKL